MVRVMSEQRERMSVQHEKASQRRRNWDEVDGEKHGGVDFRDSAKNVDKER